MEFNKLRKIEKESDRVNELYNIFNEDARLNNSKAARVEFLTTVKYIEKYLKAGDKIIDIGAGAGEYSLHFAKKGYEVTAVELTTANINVFKSKLKDDLKIDLHQGNALDLSRFSDKSFDIVLIFGPLYHLEKEEDREKCIKEAMRICKDDGTIFFAFISNDMVIITELNYNQDFFKSDEYNHDTFKVEDFPFVFLTVEDARKVLLKSNIKILHEVASDGVSELISEQINKLDDYSYNQYLKYHFYCCEKQEMLGRSNHLLFVGKK